MATAKQRKSYEKWVKEGTDLLELLCKLYDLAEPLRKAYYHSPFTLQKSFHTFMFNQCILSAQIESINRQLTRAKITHWERINKRNKHYS